MRIYPMSQAGTAEEVALVACHSLTYNVLTVREKRRTKFVQYSGCQVIGKMKAFFEFEIFESRIFGGWKIGGLI